MKKIKKVVLLFTVIMITATTFGQTITIYGKVTKGDGSRLKGTSTMKGYEDQLIIANYTGGSDNTATIEIEVPSAAYVADFRNMIKATPQQTVAIKPIAVKPIAANAIKPSGRSIAIAPGKIATQSLQTFSILRLDISVTNRVSNALPTLSRQVILEDVTVESCTDIVASNTTKIKLKANRIGWIYYSADAKGNIKVTGKSGWDTVTGLAWTNF